MATIDDLISNIMGQTDQALNAGPAPWQQELLESVNPEKVRRQNIARALAKASTAMATTPGNFLSGVAAATSTGADAYLTGRDEAEDQRIKVQQLLQMQQQKDQDRRLGLLMDALGVQQNKITMDRQTQEHKERVPEREKWDYEKEQNRLGLTKENKSLQAARERNRGRAAPLYFQQLKEWKESPANYNQEPSDEVKQAIWEDVLLRLGLDDETDSAAPVENTGPQVVQPGKTDQLVTKNSGITQPPAAGAPEATKTINGKTYVKINGKWFEQQ